MRLLIVCRHGNYATDGERQALTEKGRKEIGILGAAIARLTQEGERVVLLSSTAPRAVQSSELLRRPLGLASFEQRADLAIDYGIDVTAAEHLIDAYAPDADVLIVMSHLEYCRDLPVRFAKRLGLTIRERDLPTGTAQAIFMDEKRVRIL